MGGGSLFTVNPTTTVDNLFRAFPRGFDLVPDDRLDALLARYRSWLRHAEAEIADRALAEGLA